MEACFGYFERSASSFFCYLKRKYWQLMRRRNSNLKFMCVAGWDWSWWRYKCVVGDQVSTLISFSEPPLWKRQTLAATRKSLKIEGTSGRNDILYIILFLFANSSPLSWFRWGTRKKKIIKIKPGSPHSLRCAIFTKPCQEKFVQIKPPWDNVMRYNILIREYYHKITKM